MLFDHVWFCKEPILENKNVRKKRDASAFLNSLLLPLSFSKMYFLDKISTQKAYGISRNHCSEPFLIKKYTDTSFVTGSAFGYQEAIVLA